MSGGDSCIPPHWTLVDVYTGSADKIRILKLAIGWDYFEFLLGCYWFSVDIGWMVPHWMEYALERRVRFAWNTRPRKLQWGSLMWEHSIYKRVKQLTVYEALTS